MKKGVRGVLIACAVLFSIGIVLCVISLAVGFDMKSVRIGKRYHGEVEEISQTFTEPISSLDLKVCSGKFTIKQGDEFKIEGKDIPKDSVKCEVDNGVLTIKDDFDDQYGIHIDFFHINISGVNADKQLTLTIPANVTFDSVKVDMAAGKSTITDLTAKDAEFYMSAGKFETKNVTVLDSTRLNMDAGSMEIKDSSINNSTIEVNAGELKIDGKVLGKTKAEVNAGGMKIKTELKDSDYTFHTDSSFGDVKINGHHVKDHKTSTQGENEMELDCNAGSIKVETR